MSEDISMKTACNLFKENLGKAEMLVYVHTFALSNSEMEIDFILGQKDKEQWKVSTGEVIVEGTSFLVNSIQILRKCLV